MPGLMKLIRIRITLTIILFHNGFKETAGHQFQGDAADKINDIHDHSQRVIREGEGRRYTILLKVQSGSGSAQRKAHILK